MKTLLVIALVAGGCVDHGPGPQPKKIENKYIRENTLTVAPQDIQRVDANLGGKVIYLGNKLVYPDLKDPKTPLAPGGAIRIVHYWQVVMPPGDGWRVFTFVRGAAGSIDFMTLPPTDMQIGLPPKKWKAGQIIQDAQDVVLRPDWRSPTATVYVGLVAAGGHQIGDRMPVTGGTVVDRAIVARQIEVDMAKAPPPAGTVYVPHAAGPITIDGMATDPGWATAVSSPELVTGDGSPDPNGKAVAKMTWDEQNLYVFVQITDTDIYTPYKQHDEPLWKADCVELFIDADGNRQGYVELQVNPNNATFDSFFATTRAQPGDEKWDSNMVTAVKVRGTAGTQGDADQGWDVEIAIPLAAVKGRMENMNVRIPPQVGDRWRLNVVRVDYKSGGGGPGVASWNRISYSDFHGLDRMLTVVFADPTGSITPQPAQPAQPAQSGQPAPAPSQPAQPTPTPPPAPQTAPVTPRTTGSAGSAATGSAAPVPTLSPRSTSAPKMP